MERYDQSPCTEGPAALADWVRRQTAAADLTRHLAGLPAADRLRGTLVALIGPDGEVFCEPAALGPHPVNSVGATRHQTIESFVEHTRRFATEASVCFVEVGGSAPSCQEVGLLRAVAVFDYHTSQQPGWCAWTAVLELRPDPAFAAWTGVLDQALSPSELADLIEANEGDFVEPPAARLLEIALTLRATQSARVHEAHRLNNGDISFEYTTTTEVAAGRDESLSVPPEVRLRLPVFYGQPPVELRCLFRYALKESRLTFRIILPGLARLLQAEAERLAGEIARTVGCPVYRGSLVRDTPPAK